MAVECHLCLRVVVHCVGQLTHQHVARILTTIEQSSDAVAELVSIDGSTNQALGRCTCSRREVFPRHTTAL